MARRKRGTAPRNYSQHLIYILSFEHVFVFDSLSLCAGNAPARARGEGSALLRSRTNLLCDAVLPRGGVICHAAKHAQRRVNEAWRFLCREAACLAANFGVEV